MTRVLVGAQQSFISLCPLTLSNLALWH